MTPTQLQTALTEIRETCVREPDCPKARGIIAVLDKCESCMGRKYNEYICSMAGAVLTVLASQWLEGKR